MNEKRKEFLENLLLKAEIAGDSYYFNMKKEVFDKSMTLVVSVQDLRQEDIAFFKEHILSKKGNHKLHFHLKNPQDDSKVELVSLQHSIEINYDMLEIINKMNKYEVFLN